MPTSCDGCSQPLGARFFADVPKMGNLCLPCHAAWIKELSETYEAYGLGRTLPDGDDRVELTEYLVRRPQEYMEDRLVEATNPQEAIDIVAADGGEVDETYFVRDTEPALWSVHRNGAEVLRAGDWVSPEKRTLPKK